MTTGTTTSTGSGGYFCMICGAWVDYGVPHWCRGAIPPEPQRWPQYPPVVYTVFPTEAIELLREIRDLLKVKQ